MKNQSLGKTSDAAKKGKHWLNNSSANGYSGKAGASSKRKNAPSEELVSSSIDRQRIITKSTNAVNKLLLARIRLQRDVLKPLSALIPPPGLFPLEAELECDEKKLVLEAIDNALSLMQRVRKEWLNSNSPADQQSSDRSLREDYRRKIVIPTLDDVKSELTVHNVGLLSTFDQPISHQYEGFIKGKYSLANSAVDQSRKRRTASGGDDSIVENSSEGRIWTPSFSEGELLMAELQGCNNKKLPKVELGDDCYEMVLRKFRKNRGASSSSSSLMNRNSGQDADTMSLLNDQDLKKSHTSRKKDRQSDATSRVKFDIIPELVNFMPRMNPIKSTTVDQINSTTVDKIKAA